MSEREGRDRRADRDEVDVAPPRRSRMQAIAAGEQQDDEGDLREASGGIAWAGASTGASAPPRRCRQEERERLAASGRIEPSRSIAGQRWPSRAAARMRSAVAMGTRIATVAPREHGDERRHDDEKEQAEPRQQARYRERRIEVFLGNPSVHRPFPSRPSITSQTRYRPSMGEKPHSPAKRAKWAVIEFTCA